MTELRKAAEKALEALDQLTDDVDGTGLSSKPSFDSSLDAITALRAALAQPEQVHVAWATEIIDALQAQYNTEMITENDSGDALIRLHDAIAAVEDAEKHYTTPAQAADGVRGE